MHERERLGEVSGRGLSGADSLDRAESLRAGSGDVRSGRVRREADAADHLGPGAQRNAGGTSADSRVFVAFR